MPSRRKIAPTPPVSAARSVSVRMRNLSWAVNVRRRGRLESSGDAADGAGTTVGLRKPTVTAPPAGLIGFGSARIQSRLPAGADAQGVRPDHGSGSPSTVPLQLPSGRANHGLINRASERPQRIRPLKFS